VKSSGSSSRARFWASWSSALALLALAACDTSISPTLPGETAEYLQWKAGFFGTDLTANITGGVEKVKLVVDLQNFPTSKTNDQWVELAINGAVIHRFNLHSPDGKPLILRHEATVRQGLLQVKVWDTGTNKGYSLTGETPHGTRITVRKGGPEGVIVTQAR
jgi:hypothetical protein